MSEYYAVQRSTDHLAHYGVKGMKWGVRRALAYEDHKALDSHFRKAAKKLAKLHDKAFNSDKYAAKSVAYGIAATGTGTLAVGGPKLTGAMLKKIGEATERAGRNAIDNRVYKTKLGSGVAAFARKSGSAIRKAGSSVEKWGGNKKNSARFRIGAGAVTAGLGVAAARNAYISANNRKYAEKAYAFRKVMDDTFAGTPYEGKYVAPPKRRKKSR